MVGAADAHHPDAEVGGLVDGELHGPGRRDVAHPMCGIDQGDGMMVGYDRYLGIYDQTAAPAVLLIQGQHADPMGVDPHQVGTR